jgi:trehalose 6-phosphate synthase/phosphatase
MPFRYAGQARFLNSTEFTPLYQEIYQDGDIVWIQDYYVVAANGAHIAAQLRIGVFLHIPFPSSELYRILTHREEILHGMLGLDRTRTLDTLIRVYSSALTWHFAGCAIRITGPGDTISRGNLF